MTCVRHREFEAKSIYIRAHALLLADACDKYLTMKNDDAPDNQLDAQMRLIQMGEELVHYHVTGEQ